MGKAGAAELGMVSPPATPHKEVPDMLTSVPTSAPTSAGPRPEGGNCPGKGSSQPFWNSSEQTSRSKGKGDGKPVGSHSGSSQEQRAGSLSLPSSHIPNFILSSQISPSLSLWMSRKLLGNAGSRDSALGVNQHLPSQPGRAVSGCGQGV